MDRKIPFDLFGEKQELTFTNPGMAELERITGKTVTQIIHTSNIGYDLCLAALPICLERRPSQYYDKKIDDYIFGAEGRNIHDIGTKIGHALMAAGALGKASSDAIMAIYYPELYKKPEEESPNE
ncbi:MAG: hypothetical protein H6Q72_4349 [Firmicutes bacterium]|nr:hypothetical protein [Bacillota bacterium]